jgi:hypothetical protein
MNKLKIEQTSDSPLVNLDTKKEYFEIKGRLIPEDPNKFFNPIIEWCENYIKDPNPQTTINLSIEYTNTSSSKALLQVLKIFEKLNMVDSSVSVNWFFVDEDMMETAQDYKSILKMPIRIKKVDKY